MQYSFAGGYGGLDSFSLMSVLFPIFFFLVFGAVVGGFIFVLVKGAKQYQKNNASPVLTVDCRVVSKRTNVINRGMHDSANFHTSTDYYVTFEVESGDRIELEMNGPEYGQLAEGDAGRLTFQGTRYQGFTRTRG